MSICNEASLLSQELEAIFQDLHRHPELGYAEHRTADIVADYLRTCGLEVTTGVALTGVVGVLDSGRSGKTLMLRADMDCLEVQELADCPYRSEILGRMHACGHDAHVTMLLGAAKVLSAHKDAFCGRIKFVFQPAEEGIPLSMLDTVRATGFQGEGGAANLIEHGILEDVDMVVGLHVQPSVPLGKVQIARRNACASSDVFRIAIVGKGGHGARPQEAIDPVPALAELIGAIHMLPTREIAATETCVLSVGKLETPGSVWNAVAEKACLSGGFRTFNPAVRDHLRRRIRELAEGVAAANRCTLEYEETRGYSPCLQNEALARDVCEGVTELLGEANVIFTDQPAMTSEDFGAYMERVPGVFLWLGVGETENAPPLHSPLFHLSTDALVTGVSVHVQNALRLLNR